jgi:hypothetical protein
MGNCKDCKFWGGKRFTEYSGYKECRGVKDSEDIAALSVPKPEWLAYTVSYEGAGLMTQPDFGCVLFEAKK